MTLDQYREQFHRNLGIMLQAPERDLHRSPLAAQNLEEALTLLYEKRSCTFASREELEELFLQAAGLALKGSAHEAALMRSTEESSPKGFRVSDIPGMWSWFLKTLYWMLSTSCFEPEEIAAYGEYILHTGHFFSAGNTELSLLLAGFVFMRFDLPFAEYKSREEYERIAERTEAPEAENLHTFLANVEFENFTAYYLNLCPSRQNGNVSQYFSSYYEKDNEGQYVCRLAGSLVKETGGTFRRTVDQFYEKNGAVPLTFDCGGLWTVSVEGTDVFSKLKAEGKSFELSKLNIDCMVLFKFVGLQDHFAKGCAIPQIDLSECPIIGGGKNGTIYKVSDEVVAKTFGKKSPYDDIIRERQSQKSAFIAGIPAPISFGFADYNGAIATLMEILESQSLLNIFASGENLEEWILRYARFIKDLHAIQDTRLRQFRPNYFVNEVLQKTDRIDPYLPEAYRGKARSILMAVDEPECLIHGDIQPGNILMSRGEMMFIDFDTFSIGKSVYDLGALFRTFLSDMSVIEIGEEPYLHLPYERYSQILDIFIGEYYKGVPEQTVRKKLAEIKVIAYVLMLAKNVKIGESAEKIQIQISKLLENIDECERE